MLILAISGSLRTASYNSAVLRAAAQVVPDVHLFEGLGELPLFNPDRDTEPGTAVERWRAAVAAADALLIASPEYAHGISGPMKNALDWLVSMPDFPGKPVALWNTSPRAHHAQDALREVLTTMSAELVDLACATIPLPGTGLDTPGILARPDLVRLIGDSLASLRHAAMLRRGQ
ncbi:NAD(P)H-dependent oxidoreductase [Massilia arenosa]|uniref:NAD(P)H-dependent oxidoreductase n=1 Tax=Zemynaea arenosa TaxID=2561931 RepID=A0A4Y9S8U1_9BURK|nr:NADPH-dependent FMN reductase [Massilia arenosa]TFW16517.1 NAD(P)H-dependent oxidoreductase [Massilia arenosa]